jgi:hypothetical protein
MEIMAMQTQPILDTLLEPGPCPDRQPAAPTGPPGAEEQNTLGLVELLLKEPALVDRLNRDPEAQRELFPRFLLIAQAGFLVYGLVVLLLLNLAPAEAYPHFALLTVPPASWTNGTALALPLAYCIGIVLSACVCLPTFYFFSLLAGVNMSWLQLVSVLAKGMAANAVFLLGILPIYVALALGLLVAKAPDDALSWTLFVGLLLPFVSGLWGLRAVYQGVMDLSGVMPVGWQSQRRCFLRRLIFSWAAVSAAVLPVMIYRLWESFAALCS